jgi:hypothetical protein
MVHKRITASLLAVLVGVGTSALLFLDPASGEPTSGDQPPN